MTVPAWFATVRKSVLLHGISSVLGAPRNPQSFAQVMDASGRRARALADLAELVLRDRSLRAIADNYHVGHQELSDVYRQLSMHGGDKWVHGRWLAASALAYPDTLEFVLKESRELDDAPWHDIASALAYHFEQRRKSCLKL